MGSRIRTMEIVDDRVYDRPRDVLRSLLSSLRIIEP